MLSWKKGKNIVELEIEVDAGVFEEGLEKAFRKNAKRFNVPGFRKGKHLEILWKDTMDRKCFTKML